MNVQESKRNKIKKLIRAIILVAAFALMTLGFANNGFKDVKNKAIKICYECIGIG